MTNATNDAPAGEGAERFDEITMAMAKDLFEIAGRSQGESEPDVQTRARIQVYLNNCLATGALSHYGAALRPEQPRGDVGEVERPAILVTDKMVEAALTSRPTLQNRAAYLDMREALGFELDEANVAFIRVAIEAALAAKEQSNG